MSVSLACICLAATAIDCDTLRCQDAFCEVSDRVLLARIDAAERSEAGYRGATEALASLMGGRKFAARSSMSICAEWVSSIAIGSAGQ